MANSATDEFDASARMSKWQIVMLVLFALMIPPSLYQRDWMWVCIASAQVLALSFGRKESQMSFPVRVIWSVTILGLGALGIVFFFKKVLSHRI
ncbi:MAG: hypothetical protein ACKVZH_14590 [Blastocatellia bacterium]